MLRLADGVQRLDAATAAVGTVVVLASLACYSLLTSGFVRPAATAVVGSVVVMAPIA